MKKLILAFVLLPWAVFAAPTNTFDNVKVNTSLTVTNNYNSVLREFYDPTGIKAINYSNRQLFDGGNVMFVDWNEGLLQDENAAFSMHWDSRRTLYGTTNEASIKYGSRTLNNDTGVTTLDWQNRTLTGGAWTVSGVGNASTNTAGFQSWISTQTNRFTGGVSIGAVPVVMTNGQIFAVMGTGVSGDQLASFNTITGSNSVIRIGVGAGTSVGGILINHPGAAQDNIIQNLNNQASLVFKDSTGSTHMSLGKNLTTGDLYGGGGSGSMITLNARSVRLGDTATANLIIDTRTASIGNSFFNIASGLLFLTNTTAFVGLSTAAPATTLDVNGEATIRSNLLMNVVGSKFIAKTSANSLAGTSQFDGGATARAIVSNSLVTANTLIFATERYATGLPGAVVIESQTAGTFTARSTTSLDTNLFGYFMIEPAP